MNSAQNAALMHDLAGVIETASALLKALAARTPIAEGSSTIASGSADKKRSSGKRLKPLRPKKWSSVNTDWPRIGGRQFIPSRGATFVGTRYRSAYKPGIERTIYVANCYGLQHKISETFRVPLAKVGTCGGERLSDRIEELRSDKYASIFRRNGVRIAQRGWDDWSAVRMPAYLKVSEGSPVSIAPRGLVVRLPNSMTAKMFDEAFDNEVGKGALAVWVDTDAGREHCRLVGADPAMARRFTAYPHDTEARERPAQEVCVFRYTGGDFHRLIDIVERIIVEHLEAPEND